MPKMVFYVCGENPNEELIAQDILKSSHFKFNKFESAWHFPQKYQLSECGKDSQILRENVSCEYFLF